MMPLVEELIPCPDPWEVARKLSHLPHLLFLDSSERHAERGRYSYVMADPVRFPASPIRFNVETLPAHLPPFRGGLAGVWLYEFGHSLEKLPPPRWDSQRFPQTVIGEYRWVVSFDHATHRAWIILHGDGHTNPRNEDRQARQRLRSIRTCLLKTDRGDFGPMMLESVSVRATMPSQHSLRIPLATKEAHGAFDLHSNFSQDGYQTAVRRVIDYIHAGDVFQVNLSHRLMAPLEELPLDLYARMRQVSPSPFGCYFDAGEFQILSASPERFLKVDADRTISTKPIKGTRRRGKTPEEDAALIRDLITNPKDRAENVMIVDLLRNDIGKVAEYGSVTVPKVCEVETYNYVHHLVSEVRGKLRKDKTPFDLLKAAFPGGSVTGAPKVRAMEIIAELEPTARGPYCGSIGFIGFDGVMDTNILIRTITAANGWLQFPVGGGIVADSDPEAEYQETLTKAQGLLKALRRS